MNGRVASLLWQGALDPDSDVRGVAGAALEAALAKASGPAAESAPLERLGSALGDPATLPSLIRLCAQLVGRDPGSRRFLGEVLRTDPELADGALESLRTLCRGDIVRTPAGCERCGHLGDHSVWQDDAEAKEALRGLAFLSADTYRIPGRFLVDDDADYNDQGLLRCGGCGTFYLWGRTEEWDVCSRWVHVLVRRQRPTEAIKLARGSLRAALVRGLDERHRAFERDLQHPRVERRVDAVRTLARGWLAKK